MQMRFLSLSLVVIVFVAMPLYLLSAFVMPELAALENVYVHADEAASRIVAGR